MENIIDFLDEYKFNGIVNIKYKKQHHFKVAGLKNRYDKIDENTIFPLGSISKAFYGTVVIMLLDKKLIKSLDDTIMTYLPTFKNIEFFNKITILECLLHTSGIKEIRSNENFNQNKTYNINELISLINEFKLYDKDAHGSYEYSTANYFIIGKICDNLCGSSKKFIQTNIFDKLKLKETVFIDDIIKNPSKYNFAEGNNLDNKKLDIPNYWKNQFYGGDICATYKDLNVFFINRHKLINKNVELLTKNFNIVTADHAKLGNTVIKKQYIIIGLRLIILDKNTYIITAGHFPGYHVSSLYSFDFKTIINTFSNIDKTGSMYHMDELAKNFLIVLTTKFKFYMRPSIAEIKQIKDFSKYIGKYKNDYTFYEITEKNNKLYLYSRKQTNELIYLGRNKFYRNNFSYIKIAGNKLSVVYYFGNKFDLLR